MADMMMRMAGRGADGTAKPIKTNNQGNLNIQDGVIELHSTTLSRNIDANAELLIIENKVIDTPFIRILFKSESVGSFKIRVVYGVTEPSTYEWEEYYPVEQGTNRTYNFAEFKLLAQNIRQIYVVNESSTPNAINSVRINGVSGTDKVKAEIADGVSLNTITNTTLEANSNLWLYSGIRAEHISFSTVTVNLLLNSPANFRLELWTYRGKGTSAFVLQESRSFNNEDQITQVFAPNSPYHRIRIVNEGAESIVITYAEALGNRDRLLGTARDNKLQNALPLTVEADDNGQGVLRVVDAAPHAYDEFSNSLNVTVINDFITNKALFEGTITIQPGEEKTLAHSINVLGYSKFYVHVAGNADYDLLIRRRLENGSYMTQPETIEGAGTLLTDYIDTKAQMIRLDIKNNESTEHEYRVVLLGVV